MRILSLLGILVLPLAVCAGNHKNRFMRRHHDLAAREAHIPISNATNRDSGTGLAKRGQTFSGAPCTYFDTGLGACGKVNTAGDFIVAINAGQYNIGICNTGITISCNGKQAQASIVDRCPGCGSNGLDFSTGLFSFFADLGVGVLSCDWWFNDNSGGPSPSPSPSPSASPSPSPSSSPIYSPSPNPPLPSSVPIQAVTPLVPPSIMNPSSSSDAPTEPWSLPPASTSSSSQTSSSSSPSSSVSSSYSPSSPAVSATPTSSMATAWYNPAVASGIAEPANVDLASPSGNIFGIYKAFINMAILVKTGGEH